MIGILIIVGLVIVLAGVETLVRRATGEHPQHAAAPYEAIIHSDVGCILPASDCGDYNGFGGM